MGSSHSMTDAARFPGPGQKPPGTLPKTLGRKRIYILPTEHGLLFSLIIGGILIGSLNYNNNLGFLLSFLLGAMAFVSLIHTYKNLAGIQVLSVRSKPVFAGEKAVFEIVANADGEKAVVEFAFAGVEKADGNLSPDREGRFRVFALAEKRGVFDPGPLTVSTQYPLGLFRAWSRLNTGTGGLVYPRPAAGPYTPVETDSPDNEEGGTVSPGVDDFHGLRAYQAGDSLQQISWKTFSRGMGLHTKSFVGTAGSAVQFDWLTVKSQDSEHKLSRLCDMILKAHASGRAYGLSLPGETIHPGKGSAHKRKCLKTLALYRTPGRGAA